MELNYNTGKKKKIKKIILIIMSILIAILVSIYIGISIYYMSHFFKGSFINGVSYADRTPEEVEQLIDDDIKKYTLTVVLRDGKEEQISARDIGLEYVSDGMVDILKGTQNPFLWPMSYFGEAVHEMAVTTAYNEDLLKSVVESLDCLQEENIIKPKSAYLKYSDEEEEYIIVPENNGTLLDENLAYEYIKYAIDKGETEVLMLENGCYINPNRTKEYEPMKKAIEELNKYVNTEITYDFDDRTQILDHDIIKDWLSVDKKYKVSINEQSIIDYIKTLESVYNTLGKSRDFVTTKKKTVSVPSGNYGFMISRGREKDAILSLMSEGAVVKREPEYAQRGYSRKLDDIGDTYAEIDLKRQYLWFYKDGKVLVKSKIVTGNASKNFATPVGVYGITYKEREATLTGEDYSTPVDYWMPFNGHIGMHDAKWRTEFGGDIYKKSGSHGCVNIPFEKAKMIYENIEKGVPVICY